jgi:hypothetical protein
MTGFATRAVALLALAALLVAATASSGSAARSHHGQISGVVPRSGPPAPGPQQFSRSKAVKAVGPTTLTFDPRYQTLINQYFTDVAHDSGLNTNVYSAATQYYDNPGAAHVQYKSTFGGSYVDNDPLPASGCDDGVDPYCLTDQQLQHEIQTVLTAKGWHGGFDHVFFLMTPNGVGSCFDALGTECTTNAFCAYHNFFADSNAEDVIYANEPYMGPSGDCVGDSPGDVQGFPNNVDADTTINTISHEHNEAITDPLTDPNFLAWVAADGSENGDLCAYGFGAQTGTGAAAYNQIINGHHYDLQEEFSNAAGPTGGCVQFLGGPSSPPPPGGSLGPLSYQGGPVMHTNTTYTIYWLPTARNSSPPVVTGPAAVSQTLTTTAGSWAGATGGRTYQWQRCSSTGKSCVDISGATLTTFALTTADAGHVVRSTVRATNVNGTSPPAASAGTAMAVDVPAVQKAPRISGRARVGKKLSGSHGSWTYAPSYAYKWLRCNSHGGRCSTIRHATRSTYRLTRRDAGHRLRLRVTVTNAAGSKAAVSAASSRVKR